MKKDYHKVLGVSKSANKSQIKLAYRKLAMKYHPDRNKSKHAHDIFIKVNEAYAFLTEEYEDEAPVFKSSPPTKTESNDELKRRMEWAKNYARYKKIKEDNIAKISFDEIQNSYKGWLVPLVSWISIGYAIIIFLDFCVLTPSSNIIDYGFDYINSTTSTMVISLDDKENKSIEYDDFAIKLEKIDQLNKADPKIYRCEITPIFNQEIYISFKVDGEVTRLFNYQSTYAGFYVFLIILLLPLITIFSKGPSILYVFSAYFITSIVFLADIILSISLLA